MLARRKIPDSMEFVPLPKKISAEREHEAKTRGTMIKIIPMKEEHISNP